MTGVTVFHKVRAIILSCLGITALGCVFVASSSDAFSDMSSDKRFQYAMKTILRHEGNYSDDSLDPGGATRWGISLRYIREEKLCENNDCKGDKNEIINLTQTEADEIYYKDWYLRNKYNQIKNEDILTKIMDFSVNAGSGQSSKLVKRAINRISSEKIPVNGIMDKQTIQIINLIEPSALYSALVNEETEFYLSIVKRNPELKKFLRGWLTRAND